MRKRTTTVDLANVHITNTDLPETNSYIGANQNRQELEELSDLFPEDFRKHVQYFGHSNQKALNLGMLCFYYVAVGMYNASRK
ncbi:MAG: hypothetical protein Q8R37_06090 [Nanoarchaeota archaeon]|nr:hypothetical protein [Nanoarchaeota archaeon]